MAGLRTVTTEWAVVMDGDLQHPPELVPALVTRGRESGLDIVVASRYTGDGDAGGLDGWWRHGVSIGSALLARSMFPVRLRNVTDPLTGFFATRVDRLDLDALHPRGFKILLELLARNTLAVGEEPFVFGERYAGHSKATFKTGLRYLEQLAALRFGRMSRFAIIGGFGAVLNILILWALTGLSVHYVVAAVISAAVTILINFSLQERFVFRDLRNEGRGVWSQVRALVRVQRHRGGDPPARAVVAGRVHGHVAGARAGHHARRGVPAAVRVPRPGGLQAASYAADDRRHTARRCGPRRRAGTVVRLPRRGTLDGRGGTRSR